MATQTGCAEDAWTSLSLERHVKELSEFRELVHSSYTRKRAKEELMVFLHTEPRPPAKRSRARSK